MLKTLAGATFLFMAGGSFALARNAPTAPAQTAPGRMISMAEQRGVYDGIYGCRSSTPGEASRRNGRLTVLTSGPFARMAAAA